MMGLHMLRVASISFSAEKKSFAEFSRSIENILEYAAECHVEIAVFPEYLTSGLVDKNTSHDTFTQPYVTLFTSLAQKYGMHIAAGTHPTFLDKAHEKCAYFAWD